VAGIANVTVLTTLLDSIAKNEYNIKILSYQDRIQSKTSMKYILIIKKLQARNTIFRYLQNERRKMF